MDRTDFGGPEGSYIVAWWNTVAGRWMFRPVVGGPLLSDEEIAALGLNAPLENSGLPAPQIFGQRDPRWGAIRLGASSYTMAGAGCAVTACAMVASVVEPELTPLELAEWLNSNGGFTSGGLLYWNKVAQYVNGLDFVQYHLWRDVAADLSLLKTTLQNGPQVVQVDFRPATSALDSHFVTAVSFTEDGTDLNIIDPWTATTGQLLKMYGKHGWTLGRAVYALVQFGFT